MTDYVLVHGAWGGHQTWSEVPQRLEAAGHRVLVATLPGLGVRQAELHPGITLTDHIDAVADQIAQAGFDRFVLAGHSYGGMVITGLAARLGQRIDGIAYVDAFMPEDGESLWHITGEFEHQWYMEAQKHTPGLIRPLFTPDDWQPVPNMVGYHPLLTLVEAVKLTGHETTIPKKAYIFATGYDRTPFPRFAAKAKAAGWDYHEAATDHYVMHKDPDLTTRVLLGLAG
ncbi:alpha/beta hydrolase [Altererythrobacter sp. KTW20L]|uniref:alpha/beta hydrolase n=1 Tax=Altererythrobacter sp. KTW20L TaxID=2942210 RepID=UPI0020BDE750|nr:alpha/beta hydrolase [Altererythrobacter sp. KTW20L]MCL6250052.1 alpha/beta hydrolase [Altererythrobacter sp. KTW20L]